VTGGNNGLEGAVGPRGGSPRYGTESYLIELESLLNLVGENLSRMGFELIKRFAGRCVGVAGDRAGSA